MTSTEEDQRIAHDPIAFAEWVSNYALDFSHEDDLGLTVPLDKMELWGISESERQADANEVKILRALGAVSFVSSFQTYEYSLKFKRQIAAYTARRISYTFIESQIDQIEQAFDEYLLELNNDSPIGFYLTYLNRVFTGNDAQGPLLESDIPGTRFDIFSESSDTVRDGYTLLRYGMKYELFRLMRSLDDKKNE